MKNIHSILNVTKNVIKKSDKFYDYYIQEDNKLFENQFPLLMNTSRIRDIMLLKKKKISDLIGKEDFNNYNDSTKEGEKEVKKGFLSKFLLSNIRKAHERSPKLPPLCPFYSSRGKILPEVVNTSIIKCRNLSQTEGNYNWNIATSRNNLGIQSNKSYFGAISPRIIKKIKIKNINLNKKIDLNFEEFQQEILFESNYNSLKYDNSEIYGHKEFYQELINNLVEEIKTKTNKDYTGDNIIENTEIKKEKIFEWGKNKTKIILTLNSINIKIKELDKNKLKNTYSFEYNLPINLIPLFYYKGYEKFKLFVLSFIKWNEENEKFEINEDLKIIINNLLSNCKDLKKNIGEDIDIEEENFMQPIDSKKNLNFSSKLNLKIERKSSKYLNNISPLAKTTSINSIQNQLFAGTNVDIIGKTKKRTKKFDIYPKEKKQADYINYNIFEFYWNIKNKIFLVTIKTPLITFSIPSYNNTVKQFINYELLFYLFKINFDSWDFYVIKYLSSIKLFRNFLSQIASIRSKKNINFYLEKYKIKSFEYTDYKIANIITSKILENLIKNPERRIDKERRVTRKRSSLNAFRRLEDKKEEKREIENKEIKKKEGNDKKDVLLSEENKINKNYILEQKCFIALVTFTDNENSILNQYKIYFDYSHFTKFKSMEKYMEKTSFLIKFLDISYENCTIKFDYESLNAFDEKEWLYELEKYNSKFKKELTQKNINVIKDESKMGVPLVINTKNKAEFAGAMKGTTITIDIREPILLLRCFDKNGAIHTRRIEVLEDEEMKLCLNENINVVNLSNNIFDICLAHNKKESEEKYRFI